MALIAAAQHELLLFALAGLIIGGLDDFLIDLLFLARQAKRRLFVYTRHPRMTAATLRSSDHPGTFAVFVPAWQEADVIGPMLCHSLSQWQAGDFRIFVGTYPNDPATIAAVADVAQQDDRVRLVILPHDGGTTKADCLNHIWAAMLREEEDAAVPFKGIILHDAEDVVHQDEIRLFDRMMDRFDMVQLPVRPLLSRHSRWIAGHYADEFAEAHGKSLVLREALGAAVPSAGVGCCFDRSLMGKIADVRGGMPFDPTSLTEDYEIGLHIAEQQGRTAFVIMADARGQLICTQEHFPETLEAALRQKARWLTGIALAGWDRMGWHGSWRERWMRLHDRRGLLAALVLLAAYGALLGHGLLLIGTSMGIAAFPALSLMVRLLLDITFCLMLWRLVVRFYWSARSYGWRQGLYSIPRVFFGNIITMLAAQRAIGLYVRQLRSGRVVWDKTRHQFPAMAPAKTDIPAQEGLERTA